MKNEKASGRIVADGEHIARVKYNDDDSQYIVTAKLNCTAPSENTKRLYSFLCDCYGSYVISGFTYGESEHKAILDATGKEPVIACFDFMSYSLCRIEVTGTGGSSVDEAIAWHEKGGIVSFAWHWYLPYEYTKSGYTGSPGGFRIGAADKDSFKLDEFLADPESDGYKALIRDIDAISVEMKKLADRDIPILFRPLHESGGNWGNDQTFWWLYFGAETYKKLWYTLYDRLVGYHGFDNLIWVFNCDSPAAADFYPGDDYCDIVSTDYYQSYKGGVTLIEQGWFESVRAFADGTKITALTENDIIPDIDTMFIKNQRWAWFAPWSGGFTVANDGKISTEYNSESVWYDSYNHERVLTLDEIPSLSEYPY